MGSSTQSPTHTMDFLPFHIYHLTEEMVKRAEKELGETSDTRKQALTKMRRYIKEEMNLNCPLDDHYLLQYLRVRKFDVEKAISTLRNSYNYKKNNPAVFGKKNFESLMKICGEELAIVLPYRDVDGAIIAILQIGHWNPTELNFPTLIHAGVSLLIGCIDAHPATQICGVKVIMDIKGLGINHLVRMSPRNLLLVAQGISNGVPVRLRAIHVFNESVILKYLWKILKIALSEKLKKRVHFHSSSFESLHSKINPALLPESLGGSLVHDNTIWVKTVEDWKLRYLELMGCGFYSET